MELRDAGADNEPKDEEGAAQDDGESDCGDDQGTEQVVTTGGRLVIGRVTIGLGLRRRGRVRVGGVRGRVAVVSRGRVAGCWPRIFHLICV